MIYTFYSYKGGVGRSMALANIAECLYRRGARVLMIDWDLEAPGLENFFFDSQEKLQDVRSQLGVIDMLLHYKRQYSLAGATSPETIPKQDSSVPGRRVFEAVKPHLLPLESLLYPIHPPSPPDDRKARALWLLPPGWRSTAGSSNVATESQTRDDDRFSRYAEAVQSFDWADFYAKYEGEAFFNWFRAQLLPVFQSSGSSTGEREDRIGIDVVLIDSRTGVTEMGGVCTRQLADVIVSFCAPNFQNLDGVVRMSESFQREELRTLRGGRLPEVVVVPARVDEAGETDAQNEFRALFERRLATPVSLEQSGIKMWSLLIPYIVKYAYRERLTIGAPDSNQRLEAAYSDLTTRLLLFSEPDSNLRTYFAPELLQLQRSVGKTGIEQEPVQELVLKATSAFASLTGSEQSTARKMLERLITVAPEGGLDTRLRAKLSEFGPSDRLLARRLAAAQVLRISTDIRTSEEMVEIASDAFIPHWPQLRQWLQEDRDFLLWRQALDTALALWERSGRNKRTLLPNDQSLMAMEWLRRRPDDLTDSEREFIQSSSFGVVANLREALEKVPPEIFFAAGILGVFGVVAALVIVTFGLGRNSMNFLYGFGGGLLMTLFDVYAYMLYRGPSSQRSFMRSAFANVLFALLGGAAARGFQTECAQMPPLLAVYIGAAAPLLMRQFVSVATPTIEYKSSVK